MPKDNERKFVGIDPDIAELIPYYQSYVQDTMGYKPNMKQSVAGLVRLGFNHLPREYTASYDDTSSK